MHGTVLWLHTVLTWETRCMDCNSNPECGSKEGTRWLQAKAVWPSLRKDDSSRHESVGWKRSCLFEYHKHQELWIPRCASFERRTEKVLTMKNEASNVLQSLSTMKLFLDVKNEWWKKWIGTEMGNVPDWFIAGINFDLLEAVPLGCLLLQNTLNHFPLLMNCTKVVDMIVCLVFDQLKQIAIYMKTTKVYCIYLQFSI